MPDVLVRSADDNGVRERFIDMGDGTQARMVVAMERLTVAGGASTFKAVSAATTNAAVIKASAAILYGIQITNTSLTQRTVKLYSQAAAPSGTDVPAMTLVVPAGQAIDVSRSRGVAFPAGLAIAISASPLDNVLSAVGAGDVILNLNFT